MEEIKELFYNELPKFDGKRLFLQSIEFVDSTLPYNNIGNEKLLFHGTPLNCINSIIENGFNLDNKSMSGRIGNEFYFSDLICQSIYYQLKYEYTGDEKFFRLLVCKVSLGNCINLDRLSKTYDINKISGYDSHMTDYEQDGKEGYEYCLFDSNQILPYCIINMTI